MIFSRPGIDKTGQALGSLQSAPFVDGAGAIWYVTKIVELQSEHSPLSAAGEREYKTNIFLNPAYTGLWGASKS
jgi:hypothetical protein